MEIYDTPQEERDLNTIISLFPNAEIYNPNNIDAQNGYKLDGMEYFYGIIDTCDLLIFRGLPFGKIPAGVFNEIEHAKMIRKIPIVELPSFIDRKMSIDDTKLYLNEVGFR
jgi:hypothetical protein